MTRGDLDRPSVERRLAKYTSEPNERGCRLWIGSRDRYGYGQLGITVASNKCVKTTVTRLIWLLTYNAWPGELNVLHTCDTPACCTLEHLFLGTNLNNIHDKVSKGRQTKGVQFPQAKLTPELVKDLRRKYVKGSPLFGVKPLAKAYGLASTTLRYAINGKTWKHVT